MFQLVCNEQLAWLIFILLGLIIAFWQQWKRPRNYPPGPCRIPFIGNLHQFGTRPFITFKAMSKKYGNIFAVDFGSFRAVVINDHKLIREAMGMSAFSGRPNFRLMRERFGGNVRRGIGMNSGPSLMLIRKFSLKHLQQFGFGKKTLAGIIQEEVDQLLDTMKDYAGEGGLFQTKTAFNLATVNSLLWIMIGERFSHSDKELLHLVELLGDGLHDSPAGGVFAFFFPWLSRIAPGLTGYTLLTEFQKQGQNFIRLKLEEQKASFKYGEPRHLMDMFIQQIRDTTDVTSSFYKGEGELNLIESILDLFMAGVDTTSTTLSWLVLFLAINPGIQETLAKEIESVIGPSRQPALEDKQSMPYTEALINEVLRYSSVLPIAVFHSTTEDVVFHSYKIPKDTMVLPNLYGANHDPEVWGDPEVFRPERFLTVDGTLSTKGNESFLPFGVGKRVCIGEKLARASLFLFVTGIYQKLKILPDPTKPTPTLDYTIGIVLQPKIYDYVLTSRN